LTDYFEDYKRQKLSNSIEDNFVKEVENLAKGRKFNNLPTREEVIDGIADKDRAFLYWIDALGVEYLSFIEALSNQKGLSISITIARSTLPTITSLNCGFYNDWKWAKDKNKKLDEIKHKDEGGYNFENDKSPIHLVKELEIISEAIDKAAVELGKNSCKKFVIASDHGASRLAVIYPQKEEKYETDTKGEHSGRCCKISRQYDDIDCAAEENGFLVLANYRRFKGSRAANVEVHGGASLEEVLVPIIELSLNNNKKRIVKLIDENVIFDSRKGVEIGLFVNFPAQNLYAVLNKKQYKASKIDKNRYLLKISDIKKAGQFLAEIYEGDNLIGKVEFKAQGKSGKINSDFEDLF
jgi:hypothetical protein